MPIYSTVNFLFMMSLSYFPFLHAEFGFVLLLHARQWKLQRRPQMRCTRCCKSVNNSSTGPNSVPFPFLLFYTWWFLRKGNFSINMNYWFFLFSICLFCTNDFVLYLDSRHQQKVILEYTIFLHFKCSKP
jgi:hypothetical protein